MNIFYHAIRAKGWGLKRYALGAALLLIIAAAPSLLPSISSHSFAVNENAVAGTRVGALQPATDSNGKPLYFEILSGNTGAAFALEASTGVFTVSGASALDFETLPLYSLTVRATADKGLSTESSTEVSVAIALLDVAEKPFATTGGATALSEKGAQLNGAAQSNGAETTVAFQWGLSTSFDPVDPSGLPNAQVLTATALETSISSTLGNLLPATTYYYRLVAKNSQGTVYGDVKSFTTYSIPAVTSIKRESPSPTNADVLKFRVTFSEAVTGVDVTDFALAKSGTASGSISGIEAVSASVYLVTLGSVTGDGTLQLNFVDNKSVVNTKLIPAAEAYNQGELYEVDNTAPVITISEPSYPYTQIGPAHWDVTYSEPVTIILAPSHISLTAEGTATGTVEVSGSGDLHRRVTIKDITGNGSLRINIAAATATDAAGNVAPGAGPSIKLIVDNIAPVSTCPAPIEVETDAAACGTYVSVPLPVYDDNLDKGAVRVTNDRTGTANASASYPLGTTKVTWRFEDPSGNYTTCFTTITVKDKSVPVTTTVPTNITVVAEPGTCGAAVDYVIPEIKDNCSGTLVPTVSGPASGSTFPVGETTISYTATDGAGNTLSGSFKIIVLDTEDPVIQCPSIPSLYEIKPGESGVIISYDAVTATDNCAGVTVSRTSGFESGALVPAGTHTYKFVATDASGNTAECSFTIKVVNNDPPTIGDSGGVLVNNSTLEDVAKTFAFKVSDGVTAADELQLSVSAADATLIPAANIAVSGSGADRSFTITPALHRHGASKITLSVTDKAGHSSKKEFVLTVVADADAPEIKAVANPVAGKEDADIPLGISVALVDKDGSETIKDKVTIAGVPADASLSAGVNKGSGIWELNKNDLPGLSIRTQNCHTTPFDLQIIAGSREASNGDEAEQLLNLSVQTNCVNDAPSFTLDNYVVHEQEDFSETSGDVTIKISLNDPDTDHSLVQFQQITPAVDWVNISVNSAERTIVLKSVKDKNYDTPFSFTIRANDQQAENNLYEQTFTVQIDSLNDAPYGRVVAVKGPEPLAFEVGTTSGVGLFPAIYQDVDVNDRFRSEKLHVRLEEGAPEWLKVDHGYVDENQNGILEYGEWYIQLVGNPPLSEEGKPPYKVKAFVTDEHGVNLLNPDDLDENGLPKRYDEFEVVAVCRNALPKAPEEELPPITLFMNTPMKVDFPFMVLDDNKAFDEEGLPLKIEVAEVDESMLVAESIQIVPFSKEQGVWLISKGLTPVANQYGETEIKLKIRDYVYCAADREGLDENGERTPIYITIKVIIQLEDVFDIPNLITPNGDGANDTWNILGLEEFQNHEIKIFDTRGRVIFYSRNYGPGKEWDGTQNGLPLPDGAYIYRIIFNDGQEKREGRITVAR